MSSQNTVYKGQTFALELLQSNGWRIDAIDHVGNEFELLVTAPGASEQLIEAKNVLGLVKAVHELGTPDLYPMIGYVDEEVAVSTADEDAAGYDPAGPLEADEMLSEAPLFMGPDPRLPVLVNALPDGEMWNCGGKSSSVDVMLSAHNCRSHSSTKIIELPPQPVVIFVDTPMRETNVKEHLDRAVLPDDPRQAGPIRAFLSKWCAKAVTGEWHAPDGKAFQMIPPATMSSAEPFLMRTIKATGGWSSHNWTVCLVTA